MTELGVRPARPGLFVGLVMLAALMGVPVLTGPYDVALVGVAPPPSGRPLLQE